MIAKATTKGLKDLQYIGNQSRPKIFDLIISKSELLYTNDNVYEIDERVKYDSSNQIYQSTKLPNENDIKIFLKILNLKV